MIPVDTIAAEADPVEKNTADVLYGDANGDGIVSNTDAALIEKHIRYGNKYSLDQTAADVDLNGNVTLSDAELIYQFNTSQISSLPYTGEINWQTYPDPENYEIINTGITWPEAETYCEENGGHLAVITTEKEQVMLEALVKSQQSRKNNYWIGLMRYNENDFDWITAESMTYTNWHPGNPGNGGVDQNAVLFYGSDFGFGEWDDIAESGNCAGSSQYGLHNFGFILEKDGTPVSDYHLWKDSTCLPTSGKYKLDCDVTSSKITVNEFLDLDLNGHSVSVNQITCNGDVTITDTSKEKTGVMSTPDTQSLLEVYGSLTLSGGTFIGNERGYDYATVGVNSNADFTLDGATVTADYSNALALRASNVNANIKSGKLIIGDMSSSNSNYTRSAILMSDAFSGVLNISGGYIESKYACAVYSEAYNGIVNISGGEITSAASYGICCGYGTEIEISGNCDISGADAGIYIPAGRYLYITGEDIAPKFSFLAEESGIIADITANDLDTKDITAINGNMHVGEILTKPEKISEYYWHPHASEERLGKTNNALYLPAKTLSFAPSLKGCGTLDFRNDRVLTMEGKGRSIWKEYDFLMPEHIYGNKKNSAKSGGLYYSGIWQELVVYESEGLLEWAKHILI